MSITELVNKKIDGEELNIKEIDFVVKGYSSDQITETEMGKLIKVFAQTEMTETETMNFFDSTLALAKKLDFKSIPGFKVDKHSTGGIGDKVSLVLLPILCATGIKVFKMSGGRLGFTGGTIEKLSTFPKMNLKLNFKTFEEKAQKEKIVLGAIVSNASKFESKLYKLRNKMQLTKIMGMIVNSIMIKKIILKNDGLILNVTVGSGAFLKNIDEGTTFAQWAIKIAEKHNWKVTAVLTTMDQPLGKAVGNKVEVIEAVNALSGKWQPDLLEVVVSLATQTLLMNQKVKNETEAKQKIYQAVKSGEALNCFKKWIANFGGDFKYIEQNPEIETKYKIELLAWNDGFINILDAEKIGILANWINLVDGQVDYQAGMLFHKKKGDKVQKNECIVTIFTNKKEHTKIENDLKTIIIIQNFPPKVLDSKILKIFKNF